METIRLTKKNQTPFIIMEKDDIFRSYGICNLNFTRPAVNLNNINIKTNLKKELEDYPKNFLLSVFYKDIKLKPIKILGEGTYGKIILFKGLEKNNDIEVVVKIPFNNSQEEPDVIKNYLKYSFTCNNYIIPIKSIEDQYGNPFIFMQIANGDIVDLNLDDRLKIKLIIYITKVIKCFYKNNLLFLDLKKENILYRCKGEKIQFFLGDIGSFVKKNTKDLNNIFTVTYPPPEYAYGDNLIRIADKPAMIYILGVFIADLYNLSSNLTFSSKEGVEYTKKEIKEINLPKFYKKIKDSNIPCDVKKIILAFTSASRKKRLTYDFDMVFDLLCPN